VSGLMAQFRAPGRQGPPSMKDPGPPVGTAGDWDARGVTAATRNSPQTATETPRGRTGKSPRTAIRSPHGRTPISPLGIHHLWGIDER
jgi:hypothetical protein